MFDFHRLAILESFGQIRVKHDATRSVFVIVQSLGHGIKHGGLRLGHQVFAHCRSITLTDNAVE